MFILTNYKTMNERKNTDRTTGALTRRGDEKTKQKRSPGSFSANLAIGAARLFAKSLPNCNKTKLSPTDTLTKKERSPQDPCETLYAAGDKEAIKKDLSPLFGDNDTIDTIGCGLDSGHTKVEHKKSIAVSSKSQEKENVGAGVIRQCMKKHVPSSENLKCKNLYNANETLKQKDFHSGQPDHVHEKQELCQLADKKQVFLKHPKSKGPDEKNKDQVSIPNQSKSAGSVVKTGNVTRPRSAKINNKDSESRYNISSPCTSKISCKVRDKTSQSKDWPSSSDFSNKPYNKSKNSNGNKSTQRKKKQITHVASASCLPDVPLNITPRICLGKQPNCKPVAKSSDVGPISETFRCQNRSINSVIDQFSEDLQDKNVVLTTSEKLDHMDDWNVDHYDLIEARHIQLMGTDALLKAKENNDGPVHNLIDNEDSIVIVNTSPGNSEARQITVSLKVDDCETNMQKPLKFTCESSDTDSVCSSGNGRGQGQQKRSRGRGQQTKEWTEHCSRPGFTRARSAEQIGMNSMLSQEYMPPPIFSNDSDMADIPDEYCSSNYEPDQCAPHEYLPPRPAYEAPSRPPGYESVQMTLNSPRTPFENDDQPLADQSMFEYSQPNQRMSSSHLRNRPVLHDQTTSTRRTDYRSQYAGMLSRNPWQRPHCPTAPVIPPPPGYPQRYPNPSGVPSNISRPQPPPGFPGYAVRVPTAVREDSTTKKLGPSSSVESVTPVIESRGQSVHRTEVPCVESGYGEEVVGSVNSSGIDDRDRTGRGLKRLCSPPRRFDLQKRTEISVEDITAGKVIQDGDVREIMLHDGRSLRDVDTAHKNDEIQEKFTSPDEKSLFRSYNYSTAVISPGWLTPGTKCSAREKRELERIPLPPVSSRRVLNLGIGEQKAGQIDFDTGECVQEALNERERVTDEEYRDADMTDEEFDMWKRESERFFGKKKVSRIYLKDQKQLVNSGGICENPQSQDVGPKQSTKQSFFSRLSADMKLNEEKQELNPQVKYKNVSSLKELDHSTSSIVDYNSNFISVKTEADNCKTKANVSSCFNGSENVAYSWPAGYSKIKPLTGNKPHVVSGYEAFDQQKRSSPFTSQLSSSSKARSQSDSSVFIGPLNRYDIKLENDNSVSQPDTMNRISSFGRSVLQELGEKECDNLQSRSGEPSRHFRDRKVFDSKAGLTTSPNEMGEIGVGQGHHTPRTSYDVISRANSGCTNTTQSRVAEAREKKQQLLVLNSLKGNRNNTNTPSIVRQESLSPQGPQGCSPVVVESNNYTVKYVIPQKRKSLSPGSSLGGNANSQRVLPGNGSDGKKEVFSGRNPFDLFSHPSMADSLDQRESSLASTPQGPPSGYDASESDNEVDKNRMPRDGTKEVVKFKVRSIRQKQRLSMSSACLASSTPMATKGEESSSGGDMDWFEMKKVRDRKINSDSKVERAKRRTGGKEAATEMNTITPKPFWSAGPMAFLKDRNRSGNILDTSKKEYGGTYEESTPSIRSHAAFPSLRGRRCNSVTTDAFSHSRLANEGQMSKIERDSYSARLKSRGGLGQARIGAVPQTDPRENQYNNRLDSVQWRSWKTKFQETYRQVQTPFIDTHCHIDFLFERSGFKGTYSEYREKNRDTFLPIFEGCVAIFCNPRTFSPENALWRSLTTEKGVHTAIGCHPKSATDFSPRYELGMRKMLEHPNVVALGEIGLDYSGTFHQHSEVQKYVLIKQCKIAQERNLPLVIHSRESEQDIIQVLAENIPANYKIHRHCFTGNWAEAEEWLKKFPNSYIGLTPLITWFNADRAHAPREVARKIPLNKLLLETDAPYFVPKRIPREEVEHSHPGYAVTVAYEVAKIKGVPLESVLKACRDNTYHMYGI